MKLTELLSEASLLGSGMSKDARAADVDQSDREYLLMKQYRVVLNHFSFRKLANGDWNKPTFGTIKVGLKGWEHEGQKGGSAASLDAYLKKKN